MQIQSITGGLAAAVLIAACSGGGGSAVPPPPAAANHAVSPSSVNQGQPYSVIELPSLGGPFSVAEAINEAGLIVGASLPSGASGTHAAVWGDGAATDLGTLGGPNSSADIVNNAGLVAGYSETAAADPLGEDFCQNGTNAVCSAVVWHDGHATSLPTFGGRNGIVSLGFNDRGQATGAAETATRDASCPPPQVLQIEAAVWNITQRTIQQLPPLAGDTNGEAFSINQQGDVVGSTGTCANVFPNGIAGTHAVLWRAGRPMDLGNLGGTTNNGAYAINNHSQIVGFSNLAGDATNHGFLWQNGVLTDLGTLPGDDYSKALWINDSAQVVGISCLGGRHCRAALWQGGTVVDLNDLVQPDTPLHLIVGFGINARGEIIGFARDTRTSAIVAFVALPTGAGTTAQAARKPSRQLVLPESTQALPHVAASKRFGPIR